MSKSLLYCEFASSKLVYALSLSSVYAIIIAEMLTIDEQISQIEETLRTTPHHKATNGFIGAMRAKIAKLRDEEVDKATKGKGGGGGGYNVKKQGDATVVL